MSTLKTNSRITRILLFSLIQILSTGSLSAQCTLTGACAATGGNSGWEYIYQVYKDGSLIYNNTSNPLYVNNSGSPITLTPGTSYNLRVIVGTWVGATDVVDMWVDWNNNGTLTDPGETIVVTAGASGTYTATITPPLNFSTTARFRIRVRRGGSSNPCGSTTYGEVVDFDFIPSTILLSSANPAVVSATINAGTVKNQIYSFSLANNCSNNTLTQVNFTTTGTYAATDVTKFQLWYNTSNNFSTATKIGTDIITSLGPLTHSFSSFTQTLSAGVTSYFWITADVPCSATNANTLAVSALTIGNLVVSGTLNNFTAYNGAVQTISNAPPTVTITASNAAICAGQSTTLTASGTAATYTWQGNNANPYTVSPNTATTYVVTGADANGCTSSNSIVVTPLTKPSAGPDQPGICAGSNVTLTGTNSTAGSWTAQAGNPVGATVGSTISGVATATFDGTASGVYYFIYRAPNGCTDTMFVTVTCALPVNLTQFNAVSNNGSSLLTWQTAQESNNHHFDIERSINGSNFVVIGETAGAGNSNTIKNYSYTDKSPVIGLNYYRLRQVDLDNSYSYSEIRLVKFDATEAITLYPNPTTGKVYITSTTSSVLSSVILYSSEGTQLKQYVNFRSGNSIDLRAYSQGVYMVRVLDAKGNSVVQKLIKQ